MTGSEYQQLVEFLGRQFAAIDQRFDSLQQHIDERFREVFGHLDAIYRRLEILEQEYQAVIQALRRIEGLLADEGVRHEMLERGVEELKRNVALLQVRIEELERRIRE